jgi:hypothetical protein
LRQNPLGPRFRGDERMMAPYRASRISFAAARTALMMF